MARSGRVVVDSDEGWISRFWYPPNTTPLPDDYILFDLPVGLRMADGSVAFQATCWGAGFVSLGAPTQAQIDFIAGGTSQLVPSQFPGDFIYLGDARYESIYIGIRDNGTVYISTEAFNPDLPDFYWPERFDLVFDQFGIRGDDPALYNLGDLPLDLITPADGTQAYWDRFARDGFAGADYMEVGNVGAALRGLGGNDTLIGSERRDKLDGGSGDDSLDGRGGADWMIGGLGDDTFYVDADDLVVESVGGGLDSVLTSGSYTLPNSHVENLQAADVTGTTSMYLTGNALANGITGNAGDNVIDGRAGSDLLSGRGGNDRYYVESLGDRVVEAAGEGNDVVYARASFALSAGTEVETLSTYSGGSTEAINLTGNELANTLYGNLGANVLDGGGGIDRMLGFGGNDRYYVDNLRDYVGESAGGGTDVVYAKASYVLPAGSEIETLQTANGAATTPISLTGNALRNTVYGNAGNNVINGGGGRDGVQGFGGIDTFVFTVAPTAVNAVTIGDFAPGVDRFGLDDAVFTGLPRGVLAADAFHIGAAAADAEDRIIYNPVNGGLYFDVDGAGGAAASPFAVLTPNLTNLAASDFIVI